MIVRLKVSECTKIVSQIAFWQSNRHFVWEILHLKQDRKGGFFSFQSNHSSWRLLQKSHLKNLGTFKHNRQCFKIFKWQCCGLQTVLLYDMTVWWVLLSPVHSLVSHLFTSQQHDGLVQMFHTSPVGPIPILQLHIIVYMQNSIQWQQGPQSHISAAKKTNKIPFQITSSCTSPMSSHTVH